MCVYPSVHFRYENENHQNGSESTEFLGQQRKQVMGDYLILLHDTTKSFICMSVNGVSQGRLTPREGQAPEILNKLNLDILKSLTNKLFFFFFHNEKTKSVLTLWPEGSWSISRSDLLASLWLGQPIT